jgi:putative ABC transport system permease protein
MSATVTNGIDGASRSVVGADVRASAPHIGDGRLDGIAHLDGVEAIAPLYDAPRLEAEFPAGSEDLTVFVVDAAELRAVQAGRPSALDLPDGLTGGGASIPAIASQTVAALAAGSPFEIRSLSFEIVGTAPDVSPFGSVNRWILVDRSAAADLLPPTVSPRIVFVRTADPAVTADVVARLGAILGPDARLDTPESVAAERRDDPLVSALGDALLLVIGVDAVLLGFAIGLALLLAGTSRRSVLGVLAAHGSPRRVEAALVAWEVGPPLLVALPVGLAVG